MTGLISNLDTQGTHFFLIPSLEKNKKDTARPRDWRHRPKSCMKYIRQRRRLTGSGDKDYHICRTQSPRLLPMLYLAPIPQTLPRHLKTWKRPEIRMLENIPLAPRQMTPTSTIVITYNLEFSTIPVVLISDQIRTTAQLTKQGRQDTYIKLRAL